MDDKKVLVFLVNGFEEIEAMAPIDLLRRAGIIVDTVSINEDNQVTSSRKIRVLTDKTIDEINFENYEMIVLPGGPGTENYMKSEKLLEKLKEFSINRKLGAICAAPTILSALGILNGKQAICFPACEPDLIKDGAIIVNQDVVKDNNIITSRGAGTAIDFSLSLIEELLGKNKSHEIRKEILYK
ncbi:DJ-1 family glyoxalase III [Leptotrichia sp. oral taxon 212]|jgi:DJ-1 family protein|uniref:DJ-1 family glyoxalase III n=1 Tax=Leptotrichia sp. oral taxon 212 TaxID=712357 RepID=UPI0006A9A4EA|nr:DJ-1 family glyoxalase III [Leptotrichia sp. oral taxon 212]ALA95501.1 glutamine amidotransferase [Leptotrichia sp. oral taxon 212]